MTDTTTTTAKIARFWSRVDRTEDCWIWTGDRRPNGYGVVRINGLRSSTHRLAYELLVGPIPVGLTIDHLCRNRLCVNPVHLEAVTGVENTRRRVVVRVTHCHRGHEYNEANTYWTRDHDRVCRSCHRDRERLRKAAAR